MVRKTFVMLCLLSGITSMMAQGQQQQRWDPKSTEWHYPVPPKVKPGKVPGAPPSDAIILFDGKDLSQWESADRENPGPAEWKVQNGELIVVPGKGTIKTKEFFGDCQLHIEFKSPSPGPHNGQDRGNSGIMLQSRYEIQVLDGDNNPTYVNGMVGSVYKQKAPEVNAYTINGEWQVYDIYWRGPRFTTGGELKEPAMVSVVLNGILIQNNYVLNGSTPYIGLPNYTPHGRMPLTLQDHGTEVAFRNIWIRNL
ncbi:hypothetical protein M2459_003690 [Parabacteroides sp. PF5-5]|uniref:3-keto-disaccharide hydrolase n=1 Tax=unclassified Parabacteroides TaxID=2649774 RepID=UPI002473C101|nr:MULTISPECIES: DUF1080 domain-containing protein [unclassified Parabacteroides]MDH6306985.1 hypothetical protein [Parabacteroides sp. PH5-39]MDH6317883.1 hypothetical protein [Parabacteroides sp. PF5-13]MDH6321645.1 hypothetical protein [Parabacteroides sp. PH5-13]MDH6325372.1 hypothetical protein [Parabacteroides sp. PH5-8]MDH6329088.1 hypothetical protein [Parabacteroides sp. PH5-41]